MYKDDSLKDWSDLGATKAALLEAAKAVLMRDGYAGLSTRAIAEEAGSQMSQIRYHFGSKEGMVLALFQYMNAQLIARQSDLFTDPAIPLSQKWDRACDFLDEDIASGYVRVLQEMIAVGWSNEVIGDAVRRSLKLWRDLHVALAEDFRDRYGSLGPFEPEDIAALVGQLFIGGEAYVLLGSEAAGTPVRQALRKIGRVLASLEGDR